MTGFSLDPGVEPIPGIHMFFPLFSSYLVSVCYVRKLLGGLEVTAEDGLARRGDRERQRTLVSS